MAEQTSTITTPTEENNIPPVETNEEITHPEAVINSTQETPPVEITDTPKIEFIPEKITPVQNDNIMSNKNPGAPVEEELIYTPPTASATDDEETKTVETTIDDEPPATDDEPETVETTTDDPPPVEKSKTSVTKITFNPWVIVIIIAVIVLIIAIIMASRKKSAA